MYVGQHQGGQIIAAAIQHRCGGLCLITRCRRISEISIRRGVQKNKTNMSVQTLECSCLTSLSWSCLLYVVCCDLFIVCFLIGGVCAVLWVVSWKAWAFGPWPRGRQSNTTARNSKQHLTCGCGEESHPPKNRRSAHLSSRGSAEGHRCNVLCILLTPTVALKSFEKKAYYISFLEPMYILGPPGA